MVTVKKRKLSQAVILSCLQVQREQDRSSQEMPLVEEKDGAKPLSTAVEELWEEKVKILGDDEEAEE